MLNQDNAFLQHLPEECATHARATESRLHAVQVRSEAYQGLKEKGARGASPLPEGTFVMSSATLRLAVTDAY